MNDAALDPATALERLRQGNANYVAGTPSFKDFSVTRAGLEHEQHPFAAILACADSRVAPELAFDQGPGDLFVVRVAGNVLSTEVEASLEYAVEMLGTRLVVVLGHKNCGAVEAAIRVVEDQVRLPGQLTWLMRNLKAGVLAAKAAGADDLQAAAVEENVRDAVTALQQAEPIIAPRVDTGEVVVIGAVKDLASGEITFLPPDPPPRTAAASGSVKTESHTEGLL